MTEMLENRTFDEINVGDAASLTWALQAEYLETWAAVTGDRNLRRAFDFATRQGPGSEANTAVVHPCSDDALVWPIQAAERGLINPILIGPPAKIYSTRGRSWTVRSPSTSPQTRRPMQEVARESALRIVPCRHGSSLPMRSE